MIERHLTAPESVRPVLDRLDRMEIELGARLEDMTAPEKGRVGFGWVPLAWPLLAAVCLILLVWLLPVM